MNEPDSEERRHAYQVLTPSEVKFLDAAVDCLIPADELGPGAREAGITVFIDRQLATAWGAHARSYRQGPWQEGTPQQGYQLPLTPREIYREGIREIDGACMNRFDSPFCFIGRSRQEEVLRALEAGSMGLDSVPAEIFFELLWANTQEGFFSDPMYGGNRGKVGWKMIGFPGIPSAAYSTHIQRHNVPYRVNPVSIQDIVDGKVKLDAEGLPIHGEPSPDEREGRCPH
jgi:gluconate 2-dehydrogenase gamma chain